MRKFIGKRIEAIAVVVCASAAAIGWCGQEAAKPPTFDVVSVKPYRPGSGPRTPVLDPTRYSTRDSLSHLIAVAYGLESMQQVAGGPTWAGTDYYEIDAATGSPATREQMNLMLRSLLADRFQLKLHKETRTLPFNVLGVAKGGPKFGPQFLKADEDGPPQGGDPRQSIQHLSRYSMQRLCMVIQQRLLFTYEGGAVVAHASSPNDIAPVIDRTGLPGVYDITLNTDTHEDWPTMLEHQLGLRVEQRKLPVDVLVIDSVARPTAN